MENKDLQIESYVKNCFLFPRQNESHLFTVIPERGTFAHLDGYAIIPLEEYEKITQPQQLETPVDCLSE